MRGYEYLHGSSASPITPALKDISEEHHLPLSDLAAMKKAGNYTDFGMKRIVGLSIALELSLKSVVMIEADLKWGRYRETDTLYS